MQQSLGGTNQFGTPRSGPGGWGMLVGAEQLPLQGGKRKLLGKCLELSLLFLLPLRRHKKKKGAQCLGGIALPLFPSATCQPTHHRKINHLYHLYKAPVS